MSSPLEFDLEISAVAAAYSVRARADFAFGDRRVQPFALPFDLAALPRVRRDAASWVRGANQVRRSGNDELREARAFGGALFERLFAGDVLTGLRESRARVPPGERLRLRLRLPPELMALPWELLCEPPDGRFLALEPDIALLRYPELPLAQELAPIDGPLQVVVVLASPLDDTYAPLKLDRELSRIQRALERPIARGQIAFDAARDVIRGPGTLDLLSERMRRPAHVLHIVSHGDLDVEAGEGVLIFEDGDGAADLVGAELLRHSVQRQRANLRLVMLNACQGALPVGSDPFSGVGAALLRAGVPAVVAMQFEIVDDAAAELTRWFYTELAAGTPIDLALSEARGYLAGKYRTRLDWAVPVLFLRADGGALFTPTTDTEPTSMRVAPAAPQPTAAPAPATTPAQEIAATEPLAAARLSVRELQRLYSRALSAESRGAWGEAEPLFAQLASADPSYPNVQPKLAEARRQLDLLALYQRAREQRDAGDWGGMLDALDALEARQPGYPDREGLRQWADAQRDRWDRYERAVAATSQHEYHAALTLLEAIEAESPGYEDVVRLLPFVRAQVAELDRRAAAERASQEQAARERAHRERFGQILIQQQAGNYKAALDKLEALLAQQPSDREAVALVATLIENAAVPLDQRLRAGRLAGQYGDPRPGVCALPQSLDDAYWCAPFAAGKYPIADGKATVQLAEFRIALYPVTVCQYRQFVAAEGYDQKQWWTDEGWKLREKLWPPHRWNDADWAAPNQPVIGVSWYEAVAFCNWLTVQAKGWLPKGWAIRLPSEAEWEVAAMWAAKTRTMRSWQPPQNELWQNVKEAGIGCTSPVGMFPQGASPYGALDMAGNVWEWCASPYEGFPRTSHQLTSDYPPNKIGPALRGGSFYTENISSS